MSTKEKLLELLSENAGTFLSGQAIAEELGVSRNSVWKAVEKLKQENYEIESRTNKGYKLVNGIDFLSETKINSIIDSRRADGKACPEFILDVRQVATSTSEILKSMEIGDKPVIVIADKQTDGKGRLGRKFESPAGTGLYISYAIKPKFDVSKSLFVTMSAAVAVCNAIKQVTGIQADIKWVNDVFINGKKVCGILTEGQMNFELGKIDTLIIGIGINCFPGSFPEDIANIAGCISEKKDFSRNELAAAEICELLNAIEHVETKEFFEEYKKHCFILGKEVRVCKVYGEEGVPAIANDITDDGGLAVTYLDGEMEGKSEVVHTGEVSVRPKF